MTALLFNASQAVGFIPRLNSWPFTANRRGRNLVSVGAVIRLHRPHRASRLDPSDRTSTAGLKRPTSRSSEERPTPRWRPLHGAGSTSRYVGTERVPVGGRVPESAFAPARPRGRCGARRAPQYLSRVGARFEVRYRRRRTVALVAKLVERGASIPGESG